MRRYEERSFAAMPAMQQTKWRKELNERGKRRITVKLGVLLLREWVTKNWEVALDNFYMSSHSFQGPPRRKRREQHNLAPPHSNDRHHSSLCLFDAPTLLAYSGRQSLMSRDVPPHRILWVPTGLNFHTEAEFDFCNLLCAPNSFGILRDTTVWWLWMSWKSY